MQRGGGGPRGLGLSKVPYRQLQTVRKGGGPSRAGAPVGPVGAVWECEWRAPPSAAAREQAARPTAVGPSPAAAEGAAGWAQQGRGRALRSESSPLAECPVRLGVRGRAGARGSEV